MSNQSMSESDRMALAIYVAMDRDFTEALDMLNGCEDLDALDTLYKMLTTENEEQSEENRELNGKMAERVHGRLCILRG